MFNRDLPGVTGFPVHLNPNPNWDFHTDVSDQTICFWSGIKVIFTSPIPCFSVQFTFLLGNLFKLNPAAPSVSLISF